MFWYGKIRFRKHPCSGIFCVVSRTKISTGSDQNFTGPFSNKFMFMFLFSSCFCHGLFEILEFAWAFVRVLMILAIWLSMFTWNALHFFLCSNLTVLSWKFCWKFLKSYGFLSYEKIFLYLAEKTDLFKCKQRFIFIWKKN